MASRPPNGARAASRARGPPGTWPPSAAGRSQRGSTSRGRIARRPDRRALAELLLERQGIVTRDGVRAEGIVGGYGAVYGELKALETVGACRRGYFVEGLGGAQFALPGAVERLRELRTATTTSRSCSRPPIRRSRTVASSHGRSGPPPVPRVSPARTSCSSGDSRRSTSSEAAARCFRSGSRSRSGCGRRSTPSSRGCGRIAADDSRSNASTAGRSSRARCSSSSSTPASLPGRGALCCGPSLARAPAGGRPRARRWLGSWQRVSAVAKRPPSGICPAVGGDQAAGFRFCGIPPGERGTGRDPQARPVLPPCRTVAYGSATRPRCRAER